MLKGGQPFLDAAALATEFAEPREEQRQRILSSGGADAGDPMGQLGAPGHIALLGERPTEEDPPHGDETRNSLLGAVGDHRLAGLVQHSHSLEGWYAHIPGIKVLAPAILDDARHRLKAALADPNPVLIFEHIMLYNMESELDPAIEAVDISSAKVRRPGEDVTLVAYGGSLFKTWRRQRRWRRTASRRR